ncbi:MAG: dTDP-4-dehydrorhamnose 3,5-epimerase [Pseudomonadota bacterium]
MKFESTNLEGLVVIEPEPVADARGHFARVWCEREMADNGVGTRVAQSSISLNLQRGTLRGIHFQINPFQEAKLVRCERGAMFDVAVDLRPESHTYRRWFGIELSQTNMRMLYIPEGFGHGFQTLEDNTQILYQISQEYVPASGSGLRYDDPSLGVEWPLPVTVISDKDLAWPLLNDSTEQTLGENEKRIGSI